MAGGDVIQSGPPGDLSGAAADEFGGASEIAADDAGAGALGGNTGQTAGGDESVRFAAPPEREGDIAADDAGATAEVTRATGE